MINVLVIVWRESLEAILVVGILLAWIARQPEPARLRHGVWLGVAAGVVLAGFLGAAGYTVQSQFAGVALELFQLAMVLLAAALIVQMVFWMHRRGRHMRRQIEERAGRAVGAFGVCAVSALAVAREGAETAVFLFGLTAETDGAQHVPMAGAAVCGLGLAMVTGWLLARGARFLNYRMLFAASEVLLLLIAGALLANGIDRLIGMDWLPPLLDPAWDTSALLEDGHGAGRLLADFAGYRARPSGLLVLTSVAYWALALMRLRWLDRHAA